MARLRLAVALFVLLSACGATEASPQSARRSRAGSMQRAQHSVALGLPEGESPHSWSADLTPRAAPSITVRVMSFNVRYGRIDDGENDWEHRRDLVLHVIRTELPDVVGLQEAADFQLAELLRELPQYVGIGVGAEDGSAAGAHTAVLVRLTRLEIEDHGVFWLSDTPSDPGSRTWGNRHPRTCTWARLRARRGGTRVLLVNSHLDHQSALARERGLALIADRIRELRADRVVVVTGDFNVADDDPSFVQFLQSTGLVDTVRIVSPEQSGLEGTFHGFGGRHDGPRVDYVLVSSVVRVWAANIVWRSEAGRYPSDHFPVTAILELPGH